MLRERLIEIYNLDKRVFALYLEGIDEENIEEYETIKRTCGLHSHKEELVVRNNMISNYISNNIHDKNTFSLKLAELAMVFANGDYFDELSIGNIEKNELPLNDRIIAMTFNTSVENVEMRRMLDKKIAEIKAIDNKKLVK